MLVLLKNESTVTTKLLIFKVCSTIIETTRAGGDISLFYWSAEASAISLLLEVDSTEQIFLSKDLKHDAATSYGN